MKRYIFIILIIVTQAAIAQIPSGNDLLKRLDDNRWSQSKVIISRMIIHGRRTSRTITSKSWIQGTDQSFTEYLSPAREKGTKMLKLGDQLWMYTPSTDRIIKISGHMLRQSVMGSDLSYEDMMEDPELHKLYDAHISGEDTCFQRPCWILDLRAKENTNVSYQSRKIWIDKEWDVPRKENLYAKSKRLLKTTDIEEVKWIQNRWVPVKIIFKDVLKQGGGTEFIVDSIEFDTEIPRDWFSKGALRK